MLSRNDISDICGQSSTLLDELNRDIIESNSARVLVIIGLLDCGHYVVIIPTV